MNSGSRLTPMRRPLRNRRMYIQDAVIAGVVLSLLGAITLLVVLL